MSVSAPSSWLRSYNPYHSLPARRPTRHLRGLSTRSVVCCDASPSSGLFGIIGVPTCTASVLPPATELCPYQPANIASAHENSLLVDVLNSSRCTVSTDYLSRRSPMVNVDVNESRFPKLTECAHFHYETVELGPLLVQLYTEDGGCDGAGGRHSLSDSSCCGGAAAAASGETSSWFSLQVTSNGHSWVLRRSYENLCMLDRMLHDCIYDRKFSCLSPLPSPRQTPQSASEEQDCSSFDHPQQESLRAIIVEYLHGFSHIADSMINCAPILCWLELDNRGNRLLAPDHSDINIPAVAAALVTKRCVAQAADEISLEVGDMISVIDMAPPEESIWWRGKRGFQVGFFPCQCVELIGDKLAPHRLYLLNASCWYRGAEDRRQNRPVLRKRGKLIAFISNFIQNRPSRRNLKQCGILKERLFGCDLGEHLMNSGSNIPIVLRHCAEYIEANGVVDGVYRLSGISSNIQRLRNAFDEGRTPDLSDPSVRQDIHSVSCLLKQYFRELPNPLLTFQLYDKFVAAVQSEDQQRLLHMYDVVQQLPPPHYRTLEYLVGHLSTVSQYGSVTGMTPKNLAIVWAPNLVRSVELENAGVAALQGVGVQAVVVEYLIRYRELIFTDKLPEFCDGAAGPRSSSLRRCRPKSLAISTPTKLLTLEEARSRALQLAARTEQGYFDVGDGPGNLPAKYHTVIDLPHRKSRSVKFKRSPILRSLFRAKSAKWKQPPAALETSTMPVCRAVVGAEMTDLQLSVSAAAPHRHPSAAAALVRVHSRSVSHDSYFESALQLLPYCDENEPRAEVQHELLQLQLCLDTSDLRVFSETDTLRAAEPRASSPLLRARLPLPLLRCASVETLTRSDSTSRDVSSLRADVVLAEIHNHQQQQFASSDPSDTVNLSPIGECSAGGSEESGGGRPSQRHEGEEDEQCTERDVQEMSDSELSPLRPEPSSRLQSGDSLAQLERKLYANDHSLCAAVLASSGAAGTSYLSSNQDTSARSDAFCHGVYETDGCGVGLPSKFADVDFECSRDLSGSGGGQCSSEGNVYVNVYDTVGHERPECGNISVSSPPVVYANVRRMASDTCAEIGAMTGDACGNTSGVADSDCDRDNLQSAVLPEDVGDCSLGEVYQQVLSFQRSLRQVNELISPGSDQQQDSWADSPSSEVVYRPLQSWDATPDESPFRLASTPSVQHTDADGGRFSQLSLSVQDLAVDVDGDMRDIEHTYEIIGAGLADAVPVTMSPLEVSRCSLVDDQGGVEESVEADSSTASQSLLPHFVPHEYSHANCSRESETVNDVLSSAQPNDAPRCVSPQGSQIECHVPAVESPGSDEPCQVATSCGNVLTESVSEQPYDIDCTGTLNNPLCNIRESRLDEDVQIKFDNEQLHLFPSEGLSSVAEMPSCSSPLYMNDCATSAEKSLSGVDASSPSKREIDNQSVMLSFVPVNEDVEICEELTNRSDVSGISPDYATSPTAIDDSSQSCSRGTSVVAMEVPDNEHDECYKCFETGSCMSNHVCADLPSDFVRSRSSSSVEQAPDEPVPSVAAPATMHPLDVEDRATGNSLESLESHCSCTKPGHSVPGTFSESCRRPLEDVGQSDTSEDEARDQSHLNCDMREGVVCAPIECTPQTEDISQSAIEPDVMRAKEAISVTLDPSSLELVSIPSTASVDGGEERLVPVGDGARQITPRGHKAAPSTSPAESVTARSDLRCLTERRTSVKQLLSKFEDHSSEVSKPSSSQQPVPSERKLSLPDQPRCLFTPRPFLRQANAPPPVDDSGKKPLPLSSPLGNYSFAAKLSPLGKSPTSDSPRAGKLPPHSQKSQLPVPSPDKKLSSMSELVQTSSVTSSAANSGGGHHRPTTARSGSSSSTSVRASSDGRGHPIVQPNVVRKVAPPSDLPLDTCRSARDSIVRLANDSLLSVNYPPYRQRSTGSTVAAESPDSSPASAQLIGAIDKSARERIDRYKAERRSLLKKKFEPDTSGLQTSAHVTDKQEDVAQRRPLEDRVDSAGGAKDISATSSSSLLPQVRHCSRSQSSASSSTGGSLQSAAAIRRSSVSNSRPDVDVRLAAARRRIASLSSSAASNPQS